MIAWFSRVQTQSKITVYVASSFSSTAITKTSIPITGIVSTASMCVFCYYVLLNASGCIMQSNVQDCAPKCLQTEV